MGACCSKFGSYLPRKEDGNVAKSGGGNTPKITKLEKKQSFVASGKEATANNGDVAIHENGDTTKAQVSVAENGTKAAEGKKEPKRKVSSSSSSSSGEEDTQQPKGVEIEKADQPNVTITPVHTENLTSHSASSPDAGTKADEVVITTSSILNEPGHTRIVEETTKTTYITSTSIVNEEMHFVPQSDSNVVDEKASKVNKTIVELNGKESTSRQQARSRSSSSSSSSSSDKESTQKGEVPEDAQDNVESVCAVIEPGVLEVVTQSEKEEMPVSTNTVDQNHEVSSSSSSSEDEEGNKHEEENKDNVESTNETGEDPCAEEIETKSEASLIQAEVKIVNEGIGIKVDKESSSSSSNSSSDNEDSDEDTNQPHIEEAEKQDHTDAVEEQIDDIENEGDKDSTKTSSSEEELEVEADEVHVQNFSGNNTACEETDIVIMEKGDVVSSPTSSEDETEVDKKAEMGAKDEEVLASPSSSDCEDKTEAQELHGEGDQQLEVDSENPEEASAESSDPPSSSYAGLVTPRGFSAPSNPTSFDQVEEGVEDDTAEEETSVARKSSTSSSSSSPSSASDDDHGNNDDTCEHQNNDDIADDAAKIHEPED